MPGDAAYDATVRVLGRFIKAHAREEQRQLFQPVKASPRPAQKAPIKPPERRA